MLWDEDVCCRVFAKRLHLLYNVDVLFGRFMSVSCSIKELQGVFSVTDAAMHGISRTLLSKAERSGEIERVARGVYRKLDAPYVPYPEIEILLKRKTHFVVALQSALRLHDFTTAMPSSLWIALSRGGRVPAVDFPLDHVFLTGESWRYGIQTIDSNGLSIPVFTPAKTVADLFKFRNKIGLDLAIESLREGLRKNLFDVNELLGAAKVNRVENVITPYVEALI